MTNPSFIAEQKWSGMLEPGSKIRPEVTAEEVERLVQRLYGIVLGSSKELVSYDDKNFLIHEDENVKNPLITKHWPYGYVLKILNSHDSKNEKYIESQIELLLLLRNKGVPCSNPIKNIYGKYYSLEQIGNSMYVVRLLEFIPGKLFHEITPTNSLLYQVGEFVAQFDKSVKTFCHDGLKNHKSVWMLQSVPILKKFIYAIKDLERKAIVEEVIQNFEDKVLAKIHNFEQGVIHGDFNEQNIILASTDDTKSYNVHGIIDFGDVSISPYIFELAIALTYMMLQTKTLDSGGLVIAGYSSVRLIPKEEKDVLKYCVAARLCQSLTLGCYSYVQDPGNDYILTTQKDGWILLEEIWKNHFESIDSIWNNKADDYLKQSKK